MVVILPPLFFTAFVNENIGHFRFPKMKATIKYELSHEVESGTLPAKAHDASCTITSEAKTHLH